VTNQSLADAVLLAGRDDWVHFAELSWLAGREHPDVSGDQRVKIVADTLSLLLDQALIQLGDVTKEGFVAWTETPPAAVSRVVSSWAALDRDPVPGDIGWVANTDLGDQRAAALRGDE